MRTQRKPELKSVAEFLRHLTLKSVGHSYQSHVTGQNNFQQINRQMNISMTIRNLKTVGLVQNVCRDKAGGGVSLRSEKDLKYTRRCQHGQVDSGKRLLTVRACAV